MVTTSHGTGLEKTLLTRVSQVTGQRGSEISLERYLAAFGRWRDRFSQLLYEVFDHFMKEIVRMRLKIEVLCSKR